METALRTSPSPRLRPAFIGLLSGLIAGLLNAIVARLLMRVVALTVAGRGSFSIGGTAVIFGFAIMMGPLLGVTYRALLPRLPGPVWLKGVLYSIGLLVILQVPILYIVPEFRQELMIAGTVGFGVFGLMNITFALMLAPIVAWLENRWPRDASRAGAVLWGTILLGLFALGGLGVLVYQLGGRLVGIVE